jgi:hypothetical protein
VEAVDLRNPILLVELFMGERLNPMIYHHTETEIPLVEAVELFELEENVQGIKKALVRLSGQMEKSKEQGDSFDADVEEILNVSKLITVAHIVILIIFGAIWVYLVKQLKRSN